MFQVGGVFRYFEAKLRLSMLSWCFIMADLQMKVNAHKRFSKKQQKNLNPPIKLSVLNLECEHLVLMSK